METESGWFPALAPRPVGGGTHFQLFAPAAERVRLLLYDEPTDPRPARTVVLSASTHVHEGLWEIFVRGIGAGQHYTWAVEGPWNPSAGHRFRSDVPLLDPSALVVSGPPHFGVDDPARTEAPRRPWRENLRDPRFKSVVVAPPERADRGRAITPLKKSVLYELHVRGFTRHESSGVEHPGTYRGLAEKIPYLKDLGVTGIELLPITEFDETEVRPPGSRRGTPLVNFWGYSPISWFSPNRRYAADAETFDGPLREFREMVERFHEADLDVIVDVVFNHTAEMGERGPTWNLRGLWDGYYLSDEIRGSYLDLSGCGNTVRAQAPEVRRMILQALRWWVHGLGVDGFRFDLATILARDERGELMEHPPLIAEIEQDPFLQGIHLIAEAWDAGGGYLVGRWPGGARWAEWNDRFRDDVRRSWLDRGDARVLAERLGGSAELFGESGAGPARGVNYVCAHDGFPLADAVSYSCKHNEANGEDNRDGHGSEVSANFGTEGPSDDPEIRSARDHARRNLVVSLLLARGTPMLLAGDEMGRTQRGNNNAYCHDSALSWLDWSALDTDAAFQRLVRKFIRLRRALPQLTRDEFISRDEAASWFRPDGRVLEWEDHVGPFALRMDAGDAPSLLLLVNPGEEETAFEVPDDHTWDLAEDTSRPHEGEPEPAAIPYPLAARSLAVLLGWR